MMIRSVNLKRFLLKLKDLARVVGCKLMKTGRLATRPTGGKRSLLLVRDNNAGAGV